MSQSDRPMPTDGQAPVRLARRLRRPSHRDPRLLAGLLLVAGSVVAGAKVVDSFDTTVPHYAATHALAPGQRLRASDLRVVRVNLGGSDRLYLGPTVPSEGLVVTRGVGDGGLVPVDAVMSGTETQQQPVSLNVSSAAVGGLKEGDLVDVWVATNDPDHQSRFLKPTMAVHGAQVRSIGRSGSALSSVSGNDATASVVVPQARVADLLDAVANGARISLVMAGGR